MNDTNLNCRKRSAKEFAADLTETTVKLTAVPSGIFAHGSGGEDEFVAEGRRDGTAGFEQCLQMRLGGLLESRGGFAPVMSMRVAAGQQGGFRNPHAVFILTQLHFGKWNNHGGLTAACFLPGVKKRTDDA
jgi:hypothetical protein